MWISILVTSFLFAVPPANSDKRAEIRSILERSGSTDRQDIESTLALLKTSNPTWKRVLTLKSLGNHHRKMAMPVVQRLMADNDIDVRTEATIRLCQWAPTKKRYAALAALRDRGVSLRRAFQTGEVKGRPQYRAEASKFFVDSLSHSSIYTRLDGALGLVEIGQEPSMGVALDVYEETLKVGTVDERRLAVHHMYVSFREPKFLRLINLARNDEDATVKRLAETLLERQ